MKKAALIVAIILVGITLSGFAFKSPNSSPQIIAISLPLEIIITWLIIFIIHTAGENAVKYSVFGYVWRTLLVRFVSAFFALAASISLIAKPTLPSLTFSFQLYFMLLILTPLTAWLLFSRNRLKQVKWLKTTVLQK